MHYPPLACAHLKHRLYFIFALQIFSVQFSFIFCHRRCRSEMKIPTGSWANFECSDHPFEPLVIDWLRRGPRYSKVGVTMKHEALGSRNLDSTASSFFLSSALTETQREISESDGPDGLYAPGSGAGVWMLGIPGNNSTRKISARTECFTLQNSSFKILVLHSQQIRRTGIRALKHG